MLNYIIKRTLSALPLIIIISFLSFALVNSTNDDIAESVIYASGINVITAELLSETREKLGLDKPFLARYWNWLEKCARFDFGTSYVYNKPVGNIILRAFINTCQLAVVSICSIIVVSLFLGTLCAKYEGSLLDRFIRLLSFLLSAMPAYWIGTLLMWALAVKLDILPTSGKNEMVSFILPAFVLSLNYFGYYSRLVRSEMIYNTNEDYVLYGRSCGLPERVLTKHVLRNSLQTAVSAFCLAIPGLLAGTVVVENVFAWPGIGRLCVAAIFSHDIPIIQAYVLILASCFVGFNLLADIINAILNPKLRTV